MARGVLLERQSLGELDHLAGGEAELVRARARVDVDLDLFQLPRRGIVKRTPMDEAEFRELPLIPKIDVFADRQVGEQGLLLEHHADPLPVGVRGAFDAGLFSGDEDLPESG